MKKLFMFVLLLCLAGCGGGGGGGGSSSTVTPDTVSGVVAAGAVISGTVYLKDSAVTPRELSKTIAADGSYTFDVTGMTKPYLLKAVGTANGTSYILFSMAADKGIANINPMTNLVVANAAGGTDPATIYTAPQAATMQAMANKLAQAVADVQTALNQLLQAFGCDAVNPITVTYKADHTGLDGMLDVVKVNVTGGTVTITNESTGATIFTGQVSNIKGGTITVGNIPGASSSVMPTITSANSTTFTVGMAGSFTVTATGSPKPTLSVSGTLPSGVTFNAATGVLSGTPAASPNGTYNVTFKASNGVLPDASQGFALTVNAATANSFTLTGTMNVSRWGHSATLLPNGKVLIVGGDNVGYSTSEIYDPATGKFTLSGNTIWPHSHHTATLLPNGKVLIAGGYGNGASTRAVEIYDPQTGMFSETEMLAEQLNLGHTATLLNDGKVLIAGCVESGYYDDGVGWGFSQLYDTATGTFSPNYSPENRSHHTATLLPNGKVLIIGGSFSYIYGYMYHLMSAEIYDPSTATFTPTGDMANRRTEHTATMLTNGIVLILGGSYYTDEGSSAEFYNPTTGVFTSAGSMSSARSKHTATLLPNGKILIAGGDGSAGGLSAAEIFNPASSVFSATGNMNYRRYGHTATLLADGKVLIAGGTRVSGDGSKTAEIYQGQ